MPFNPPADLITAERRYNKLTERYRVFEMPEVRQALVELSQWMLKMAEATSAVNRGLWTTRLDYWTGASNVD